MITHAFFDAFPPVSKADWLAQIAKDLKDKSLEDLNWSLADDLKISPLTHADDFSKPAGKLWPAPKNWEINELIQVDDPVAANRVALNALEGGVEGLRFALPVFDTPAFLETLLQNVHLDYIGLHFEGASLQQNPSLALGFLAKIAEERGLKTEQLRGSLAYRPIQPGLTPDWRYLSELLAYAQTTFPGFKLIEIPFSLHEHPVTSLSETLGYLDACLKALTARGVSPDHLTRSIRFSIPVGRHYFFEIAKLRALQILWLNVLKAWGAEPTTAHLSCEIAPEAFTDDLYTNMIRGTSIAMSAIIGGASQLTVQPYDQGREQLAAYPPAFGRRIARNVQHLLKMESHLDGYVDAAAGSYYIEQLTNTLAEKAWVEFV
ncbi:MAG: hypothetical protein JNJ57_18185 [Saprospiraceae bacterium]|nr:hypothetical protein [Saprospiraceae bacterium]